MADRSQQKMLYPQTRLAAAASARDSSVDFYVEEFERFVGAVREPAALTNLRREAIDRFAVLGFPTRKNEDWHFTSVVPITSRQFALGGDSAGHGVTKRAIEPYLFDGTWPTLVFVNGRFARDLSVTASLPEGVAVSSLREALDSKDMAVVWRLTTVADFRDAAFTALNTAFFTDGAVVRVAADAVVDRPIHLLFVADQAAAGVVAHPRNLVIVERHARAQLIESYIGLGTQPYFTNAVTEIALEDGALLDHVKIQREGAAGFHVGTSSTHQARDSVYHSFSYATGAELSRTNIYTLLDGEGGTAILNGLYMVDGTQHVDHQTRIEHAKPSCTSHEIYKGVLDGRAHGVFNGKVFVRPEAQKTDGKQSNNNLLLSPHAQVDTKPQLEIFADDVKCTHGATVGRLDDLAMFYMRSRGIAPSLARTLLTYAFAAEVLDEIAIDAVQDGLEAIVLARVGAPETI